VNEGAKAHWGGLPRQQKKILKVVLFLENHKFKAREGSEK